MIWYKSVKTKEILRLYLKHSQLSCDHNYFLLGGYVKEMSDEFLKVMENLSVNRKVVEAIEFRINGFEHMVKFEVYFIASGELNNASRYPSPFGNVQNSEIGGITLLDSKFREGQHWQPWHATKIGETVRQSRSTNKV